MDLTIVSPPDDIYARSRQCLMSYPCRCPHKWGPDGWNPIGTCTRCALIKELTQQIESDLSRSPP